jgi:hypothetical protein
MALRELLLDSWVSDGKHGYFVDDAWSSTRSPFSLYDTYWNLRLGELDPQRRVKLKKESVARWLEAAQRGQAGRLPAIAQIHYAAHIAMMVGADVDRMHVGDALETLREDGRYRTGGDSKPNWGSTDLAVDVLVSLGLPVPDAVTTAVRNGLEQVRPPLDAPRVVEDVAPLLSVASTLKAGVPTREALLKRINEAVVALGEDADNVWLAAQASLRQSALRLGGRLSPLTDSMCDRLHGPGRTIAMPGAAAPDPQLSLYARSAGCVQTVLPPPEAHSRAGWPLPEAVGNAMQATTAGVRLSEIVDVRDLSVQERVRNTVFDIWLPNDATSPDLADLEKALQAARLRALGTSFSPDDQKRLDQALGDPPIVGAADDLSRMLALANIFHVKDPSLRRAAAVRVSNASPSTATSSTIFAAVADELIARILGSDAMHARAVATTRSLHVTDGLYALGHVAESALTTASAIGSMTASVLAAWITGSSIPILAWNSFGLCQSGRCAESAQDLAGIDASSIVIVALMRACVDHGCGERLPIIL